MANSAPGGASDYDTASAVCGRAPHSCSSATSAPSPGSSGSTPVACSPQGGGRFAIGAANGGSPTHPNWYYNLKAHPTVTVEVGTQTFTVLAEEPGGTARRAEKESPVPKNEDGGDHDG
jgi:hypothetical protein